MRLLVLGGTSYLSQQVARDAVARGHDVVCAARGRSGEVPSDAELIVVDRDQLDALAPLAGQDFDAVVDVATGALGWVRDALDALVPRVGHWTFVSSINVYSDTATLGQGPDAPVLPAAEVTEHLDLFSESMTVELYGGTKVASENAVRDRFGEHALIVRPGIISGPGDLMDRFGYYAARFACGGRVVVPDSPAQPVQHIDVRDCAAWIVTGAEQDLSGTYDAIGPVLRLGDVLRETAELVGASDLQLVPASADTLIAHGVNPWGGPRSLPLWLPPEKHGLLAHDPEPAAAGLITRPLADTVHTALADEQARGLDRARAAGLTEDEEQALLAGMPTS